MSANSDAAPSAVAGVRPEQFPRVEIHPPEPGKPVHFRLEGLMSHRSDPVPLTPAARQQIERAWARVNTGMYGTEGTWSFPENEPHVAIFTPKNRWSKAVEGIWIGRMLKQLVERGFTSYR